MYVWPLALLGIAYIAYLDYLNLCRISAKLNWPLWNRFGPDGFVRFIRVSRWTSICTFLHMLCGPGARISYLWYNIQYVSHTFYTVTLNMITWLLWNTVRNQNMKPVVVIKWLRITLAQSVLLLITFSAVYLHRARLAWRAMDWELANEGGGGGIHRVDGSSGFGNNEPASAGKK